MAAGGHGTAVGGTAEPDNLKLDLKPSLPAVVANSPTFIDFLRSPTWTYSISRFFGDALYGMAPSELRNYTVIAIASY